MNAGPKILVASCALALLAGPSSSSVAEHVTLAGYLQRIGEAYVDLPAQLPAAYTCRLRSPELVASFDPGARRAWGESGYVVFGGGSGRLELEAAGLAQPAAKGLFDLALGIWKLRLATELKVLEAHLPAAIAALAAGALASPLSHDAFDWPIEQGGGRHFGLSAKRDDAPIRELAFEVGPDFELRAVTVRNKDGTALDLTVENRRAPSGRFLVSAVEARVGKRDGDVEVIDVELDYTPLRGGGDALVFERIFVSRRDADGRPIRDKPGDVNPVSFRFSDCAVDRGG